MSSPVLHATPLSHACVTPPPCAPPPLAKHHVAHISFTRVHSLACQFGLYQHACQMSYLLGQESPPPRVPSTAPAPSAAPPPHTHQAVKFVDELMSIKTDKLGSDTLLAAAKTSMGSKIVGSEGEFFARMVVDAIQSVKMTDQVGGFLFIYLQLSIYCFKYYFFSLFTIISCSVGQFSHLDRPGGCWQGVKGGGERCAACCRPAGSDNTEVILCWAASGHSMPVQDSFSVITACWAAAPAHG